MFAGLDLLVRNLLQCDVPSLMNIHAEILITFLIFENIL